MFPFFGQMNWPMILIVVAVGVFVYSLYADVQLVKRKLLELQMAQPVVSQGGATQYVQLQEEDSDGMESEGDEGQQ